MKATYKVKVKESEGWMCTDQDTDQWVKKISETKFEVLENGMIQEIDLEKYTDEEIIDYISSFGYDLDSVKEIYGESANQIIAECIAETDSY